jgi:hypothetical protein
MSMSRYMNVGKNRNAKIALKIWEDDKVVPMFK